MDKRTPAKKSPVVLEPHEVPDAAQKQSRRVIWVVEGFDTAWNTTEWVGATRERAREQAKEWRAETSIPVRVVKYVPAGSPP